MGNIFAIYPGKKSSLLPIGMGSHLDTQPAGSHFNSVTYVVQVGDLMEF